MTWRRRWPAMRWILVAGMLATSISLFGAHDGDRRGITQAIIVSVAIIAGIMLLGSALMLLRFLGTGAAHKDTDSQFKEGDQ